MQVSIDVRQFFFVGVLKIKVFNNLNLFLVAATATIFWLLLNNLLGVGVFELFVKDKVLDTGMFVLLRGTLLTIIITWIWLIGGFSIIKTIVRLHFIYIFNCLIACKLWTVVVLESHRWIL